MTVRFTERELDIMQVLWDRGESTVSEVQASLDDELAYNTVLTMLRVLEEKGHVTRTIEGRAHRYHPAVEREEAGSSALGRVTTKLFQGSPEALLLNLVRQPGVTREEVRRMRDLLDRALGDDGGAAAGGDGPSNDGEGTSTDGHKPSNGGDGPSTAGHKPSNGSDGPSTDGDDR